MRVTLPTDPGREAVRFVEDWGWCVVPLCWPGAGGTCACGKGLGHRGREGKVPLLKGWQEERATVSDVRRWWHRWPRANVGLLLGPSGVLVVDLDGGEGIAEARSLGLYDTLTARTRKGLHLFYKCPPSFPAFRVTQRGTSRQIDILSAGFVVLPPSVHRSGHTYHWDHVIPTTELPYPPPWVCAYRPPPGWIVPLHRRQAAFHPYKERNEFDTDEELMFSALGYLDPDAYDLWLHVGMALKLWDDLGNGKGAGFRLWDQWSQRSSKYPGATELKGKWRSFARQTGIGLGRVYAEAKRAGFVFPQRDGALSGGRERVAGSGAKWMCRTSPNKTAEIDNRLQDCYV